MRAIWALLFVTELSPVDAHKDKAAGWGDTLKCASCPGCCGKRQEAPVQHLLDNLEDHFDTKQVVHSVSDFEFVINVLL